MYPYVLLNLLVSVSFNGFALLIFYLVKDILMGYIVWIIIITVLVRILFTSLGKFIKNQTKHNKNVDFVFLFLNLIFL